MTDNCECHACYMADLVTDDDEWRRYWEAWDDEHLTADLLDMRRRLAEVLEKVEARLASLSTPDVP